MRNVKFGSLSFIYQKAFFVKISQGISDLYFFLKCCFEYSSINVKCKYFTIKNQTNTIHFFKNDSFLLFVMMINEHTMNSQH